MILTSHRGLRDWGEVLGDNVIAAGPVDRLLRQSNCVRGLPAIGCVSTHTCWLSRCIRRLRRRSRNVGEAVHGKRRRPCHSTADHRSNKRGASAGIGAAGSQSAPSGLLLSMWWCEIWPHQKNRLLKDSAGDPLVDCRGPR